MLTDTLSEGTYALARYFFDSRDEEEVIVADVGLNLPDFEQVKWVASKALAEMAGDELPGANRRSLGITVRDESGRPVLTTGLTFEARILAAT